MNNVSPQPGTVLRLKTARVCYIWKLKSIEHGALGQESVVELESLTHSKNGVLRMPIVLLRQVEGLESV